jgi:beta-ureidopropionase / N-carbamoyl-L-amino-acid hydrolase
MPTSKRLRINGPRLQRNLEDLARFGAIAGGGVCRPAFGRADKEARDFLEDRMRALGLAIHIDSIGNLFGIRNGRESKPVVLCGSHADTVGTGGRFDGSVGVLGGLEVLETLNEAGVATRHPLGVVSFVNEEGARFTPDMMGSLVFRGDLSVEAARRMVGIDGTTVGGNIDENCYAGPSTPGELPVRCYVELHIEQGPVLERDNRTIGVVEGVQGIKWISFTLRGATAHAGAMPIHLRHDAAYVAGATIQYARQLSLQVDGQRATVGSLVLSPNLVNVVAEEARLTVDLRNADPGRLSAAEERLSLFVNDIAGTEGVRVEREVRVDVAPVMFDPSMVDAVENAAKTLGYSYMRMISGAGHDAQVMAGVCPAAMIFVPSRGGISHNVAEYSAPEHIEAGANVLLHTLLRFAD